MLLILPVSLHANSNKILILGDSLSAAYQMPVEEGWVALLSHYLVENNLDWQVLNYSQSGETTGGGRQRLQPLLKTHRPNIVIIELGGNDGLRGLPPRLIERNLDAMISLAHKYDAIVLLVGMRLPPNYSDKYTKAFENIFTRLSQKYELAFVPFLLEDVATQKNLMMADQIHPTKEAQPYLLQTILLALQPLLNGTGHTK